MDMKEHLAGRHLNPSHYQMHWDGETACFYLFNLSGEFCGYQQYRPGASKTHKNSPKKGRYYTYLKDGSLGVWGLESYDSNVSLGNRPFSIRGTRGIRRIIEPTPKMWMWFRLISSGYFNCPRI